MLIGGMGRRRSSYHVTLSQGIFPGNTIGPTSLSEPTNFGCSTYLSNFPHVIIGTRKPLMYNEKRTLKKKKTCGVRKRQVTPNKR